MATSEAKEEAHEQSRRAVVAAVDESETADAVYSYVCSHFNNSITTVYFVHVLHPIEPPYSSTAKFVDFMKETGSKKYLAEGWVARAHEDKVAFKAESRLMVGDAREEIERLVEQVKATALVVGSHGRGPLARLMLGSVSTYLVNVVPCPVIVVKSPKPPHGHKGAFSQLFNQALGSFAKRHKEVEEELHLSARRSMEREGGGQAPTPTSDAQAAA